MAKQNFKKGTTSKSIRFVIQSATTGNPITGLVFNSTSLAAYYIREGDSSVTTITLVTMTLGTWVSGGFKEVDSTKMPGVYELGIPNAAIAGANSCLIGVNGYSGMLPVNIELQLEAVDNQDAAAGGMSRIDAAISSRSTLDGTAVQTALTSQGYTATRAGYMDVLNGIVAAIWANASRTLSAFGFTVSTNANATETAIKAKTDNLPSSPAAVGSAMTLDMTQAVPTTNTGQTVGDAFNAARAQGFGKWVIDGTAKTITLYAADGTTSVRTFNVDSATAPTTRS